MCVRVKNKIQLYHKYQTKLVRLTHAREADHVGTETEARAGPC
jgi:hypothetical protein